MTPDEFRQAVLPQIADAWDGHCFCANSGFRKLLSFNFRDYDIGPVALADSEILINEIIRRRFKRQHEAKSHQGETTQTYVCPQCQATCTELYAEFSICMWQSSVTFDHDHTLAREGLYLVGFYGFNRQDFERIRDFGKALTRDDFVCQLLTG